MRDVGKDTVDAVFRDAQVLAATYGAALHPASHGEFTLITRTSTTTHASLHAALKSLKPPVEYLLDRLDAIPPAAPAILPLDVIIPRLPERGAVSPDDIRHVAGLLGVQVQTSGNLVMLTGSFGCHTFVGWSKVCAALNRRAFTGKFYD